MMLLITIALLASLTLFSRNIVYSLVSLVGAFFFSGVLLVWVGLEFLGYVVIIAYVGAIAILFLFVVMTLDVAKEGHATVPSGLLDYVPHVVALAFTGFILKMTVETVTPLVDPAGLGPVFSAWVETVLRSGNLAALYYVLYLSGFPFLFVAGLLLLLAMMGAVFLTQSLQSRPYEASVSRSSTRAARVGRRS